MQKAESRDTMLRLSAFYFIFLLQFLAIPLANCSNKVNKKLIFNLFIKQNMTKESNHHNYTGYSEISI